MANFETALGSFVEGCSRIHVAHQTRFYPNCPPDTFNVKMGKRYAKIIRGGSVHCFVDRNNGDVLKAAGWKAPAKHARGNIFDNKNGLGSMNEYGPAYLR